LLKVKLVVVHDRQHKRCATPTPCRKAYIHLKFCKVADNYERLTWMVKLN